MYSHEYQVDPSEPLTQDELRQVFVSFKSFLVAKGMRELPPAKAGNVDDAAFQFGSGKSGLLREPFEEYLRLSYTPESGFHLAVVRVISHPVDFSEQYLAEFKAKTEQFIHEATNKMCSFMSFSVSPSRIEVRMAASGIIWQAECIRP